MEAKTIPKGTLIYRSYNDESNRNGYWFSLNASETYGYGKRTGEFRILRDLNLIDIIHPSFYKRLKEILREKKEKEIEKNTDSILLFPLGFDDTVFYRDFAEQIGIDYKTYPLVPFVHTQSILHFNNRSRLSINQIDIELMKFLKLFFEKDYDGILSDKNFPDIIRNGFHCTELSVFDNSFVEFVREIPRIVSGGSINNYLLPPIRSEDLSDFVREACKEADRFIEGIRKSNEEKEKETEARAKRRTRKRNSKNRLNT